MANGGGGVFLTNRSDGWNLSGPNDPGFVGPFVYIYANDNYQLYNDNEFGGSFAYGDPGNIDARYVAWGTINEAEIQAGIYDFFDDATKGFISYSPFVDVPLPFAIPGDTDADGDIDLVDLGNLAGNYGTTSGATWKMGDFDGDGDVDVVDLGALAGNYGYGVGPLNFDADTASLGLVPEPATLCLLLGGLAFLRRKQR